MNLSHEQVADTIRAVCKEIETLLIDKNRKYGNSAISPIRVFSKAETLDQLDVRMDDKLSRIKNMQADDREDAEYDLTGYMVLKLVAKRLFQAPSGTNTPPVAEQPASDLEGFVERLKENLNKAKTPPSFPPLMPDPYGLPTTPYPSTPTVPFPFRPYQSRGLDYRPAGEAFYQGQPVGVVRQFCPDEQVIFGQQVSEVPKLVEYENGFRHTLKTPITD